MSLVTSLEQYKIVPSVHKHELCKHKKQSVFTQKMGWSLKKKVKE